MKIGGPSDHSDGVSTHKFSNKKVCTGVYCFPTDILLSEIKSKFVTAAVLAAMISLVKS